MGLKKKREGEGRGELRGSCDRTIPVEGGGGGVFLGLEVKYRVPIK